MIKEKFFIKVCLDKRLYSFLQDEKISNMVLTFAPVRSDLRELRFRTDFLYLRLVNLT